MVRVANLIGAVMGAGAEGSRRAGVPRRSARRGDFSASSGRRWSHLPFGRGVSLAAPVRRCRPPRGLPSSVRACRGIHRADRCHGSTRHTLSLQRVPHGEVVPGQTHAPVQVLQTDLHDGTALIDRQGGDGRVTALDLDQQRLVTKVAWLYHVRQMRQRDIALRLEMSQSLRLALAGSRPGQRHRPHFGRCS